MYERIVVGTDGSRRAHDAVRRAGALASRSGLAEIDVVSSSEPPRLEIEQIRRGLPAEYHDLVGLDIEADHHVAAARAILNEMGVRTRSHPMTGDPAEAILDVAVDRDADLIVVGARGLNAIERFLHGSVSTRVAHRAPCDVLIVEHDL